MSGAPIAAVVGLARTLRAAGVEASPGRVHELVRALDVLDPARVTDVYWAGRLTLCADEEDIDRYDRVFAAYFGGGVPPRPSGTLVERPRRRQRSTLAEVGRGGDPSGDAPEPVPAAASRSEVLRSRDIADLTPRERAEIDRLLRTLRLPGERRTTRRRRPARRGTVDRSRTVRELLRRGGEPARLRHERRAQRPRRVVLLVDVSGSMAPYADALLRFAHATSHRGAGTEVFTIGTRLTRVTRELSLRDPDAALAAVATAVPDWSGGTRLGDLLKRFLDTWGQRGTARGAVVVVLSDGWERGDVTLLGEQMARLQRLAHRVVWANPRKGRADYEPLAAGMAAALPHVDDFVAGHSLAALEELARVVAGATRRAPRGAARA